VHHRVAVLCGPHTDASCAHCRQRPLPQRLPGHVHTFLHVRQLSEPADIGEKSMRNVRGLLAGCTLLLASPLAAQENRVWPERTFVTIDVPFQPLNNDFSESLSFADTLRKSENVTFVADYESTRGALIDVVARVRLASQLGVGLTTSWFQHSGSGTFDLKVPN